MKPPRTVTIEIPEEKVQAATADFMAYCWYLQTDIKETMEFLNGCPVAKGILGIGIMSIVEHLLALQCIDHDVLLALRDAIEESAIRLETPASPPVLM